MLYLPRQITVYFIVIEYLDGWVRPPKTPWIPVLINELKTAFTEEDSQT